MVAEIYEKSGRDAGLRMRSSIADDVWHPEQAGNGSYEWWYFDAISDDGRTALVVIFLADFIFSPRFNGAAASASSAPHAAGGNDGGASRPGQFPAIAVCLYRDGRPVLRAITEYGSGQFTARTDHPFCRIGQSSFDLETTAHGSSYCLTLDEPLRRNRRFTAALRWTIMDGDFTPTSGRDAGETAAPFVSPRNAPHDWNLVAPRCRVSGTLAVTGRGGARVEERRFDGVGYHDHNHDRRWMPATIAEWHWGRAHFDDATVVFYSYRERTETKPATRLFVVRDRALSEHTAHLTVEESRRHHFGLRHPRVMVFSAEQNGGAPLCLRVERERIVDASYFYLRFLDRAQFDAGNGRRTRQAPAISEYLAPRALRWRQLDWLTNMRIGRNGRSSFLP